MTIRYVWWVLMLGCSAAPHPVAAVTAADMGRCAPCRAPVGDDGLTPLVFYSGDGNRLDSLEIRRVCALPCWYLRRLASHSDTRVRQAVAGDFSGPHACSMQELCGPIDSAQIEGLASSEDECA